MSTNAARAAVPSQLKSIFSLKEHYQIFLVHYFIFALLPEYLWTVGSKVLQARVALTHAVQSRQPQVCEKNPGHRQEALNEQ